VGRTGRGTHRGNAVSFCSDEEREILVEIEDYLDQKIQVLDIPRDEYQVTIDFSEQAVDDWKTLLKEEELREVKELNSRKKKKK
jgi:ATP-dependent RNA helicase RhlE